MKFRALAMGFVIAALLPGRMPPAHGAPPAQAGYHVRPIIKVGDTVDGQVISPKRLFYFAGFSDQGQLVLDAYSPDGSEGDLVLQYLNGQFTTILAPGGPAPDGTWPATVSVNQMAMNSHGAAMFSAIDISFPWVPIYKNTGLPFPISSTQSWLGTDLWNPDTGKLSVVAKKGMPATVGYSLADVYDDGNWREGLAINNSGDVLLGLWVKGTDAKLGSGLFLLGHDGTWQPILVPNQVLPNGKKLVEESSRPIALDDAGEVLFGARGMGQAAYSIYLWSQGKATPVLAPGAKVPGGAITQIGAVRFRNVNHEVVVAATVGTATAQGIYRVVDGQPIPVAVPGQTMPGGGVFETLRYVTHVNDDIANLNYTDGLGTANLKGEIPFLATLDDGTPALYVSEPDGTLTPVLQQGQVTDAGTITGLGMAGKYAGAGPAPAINDNGEIVIPVEIDNGPRAVAILTPPAP